ncbi:transketolase [Dehalogenimonas sp. 4OHTPN]|uniref:Transketolase n=1 Tax=Dehalogenimonas sp. 4OHTPN TaxID=3166643 RepID=A0AAU8G712_9CHLR
MNSNLDILSINVIRFLSADMVQKAASGHPGAPMGAAAMAYTLWQKHLKHNPADPSWCDRDRFVLSAGHASALLYSLLYLTGYDLSIDDLQSFRQWGSKTPGHPEHGLTPGVEATTGPLGQGFGNGVGMAIAEKWAAARFNKPGYSIVDHYTYAICSDGDLMEGVASESASLAGTLGLGKLIYLYDDNKITIEGDTANYFNEDVGARFRAYGWHVIGPIDGMDPEAVDTALKEARSDTTRPKLIICRTIIGYGAPTRAGTGAAHGEPLGDAELSAAKECLGCSHLEPFKIPAEVLASMSARAIGKARLSEWQRLMNRYSAVFPVEAAQFQNFLAGNLPHGWNDGLENMFNPSEKPIATREASGKILNLVGKRIENLLGGSADLAPSTKTVLEFESFFGASNPTARNLQFGVREHAMGAVLNGLALHGGIIPYGATFLVFYDYMRPSVRLAAIQELNVVYVFTHDSIGLGEDGPTHQPVEHLAGLRSVPHLVTIRPADAAETAFAWEMALGRRNGPTALVLTRQKLPIFDRTEMGAATLTRRGGYILWQADYNPKIIFIATGSEVHLALAAAKILQGEGITSRVVSLPSWEVFEAQPQAYRDQVLPPEIWRRVSVEAGRSLGWERYVGCRGVIIGLDRFGASAPGNVLLEKLGFTAQHIAKAARTLIGEMGG